MTKIKYDLSGQDPDESVAVQTRESPKPGMYVCTILEVNERDSGGDPEKPMLEVVLEISDADKKANLQFAGSRLWWYVLLPDHPSFDVTAWKLDQLLQATGFASKRKRKGVFDPDKVIGMEVMVSVRAGKAQDGTTYRGEVGAVLTYDEDSWEGSEGDEAEEDIEIDDEDVEEIVDDDEDVDVDEEEEEEPEEEEDDLTSMTLTELRKEARAAGINVKGLSKDEIIEELQSVDEDEEEEDEEEEDEEEEEEEPEPKPRARRKTASKKPTTRKKATARKPATRKKVGAKQTGGRRGKRSEFPFDE